MSLQVFNSPVSLASLTLLHLGVSMAANLGGFEDDPNANTDSGNDGKDTTAAKETAAKETAAKETAAKETAATETAAKETAAKDTATGTTVWWTPATPTTATATTANKAESQKTADSKTTAATSSGKYNQYGFLGSQSVWQASTLESSTSGSLSVASIHNKTSGANAVRGHVIPNRDSTMQKAVLIGGFVGVGLLFQAL